MNWRSGIRMNKYSIIIEPLAEEDIIRNVEYIAYDKRSQQTALELGKGFRKQIASLALNPARHAYDDDEKLAQLQIRKHYYKNYKIYYFVDEREKKIYILRVLHMLVDSKAILLRMMNNQIDQ